MSEKLNQIQNILSKEAKNSVYPERVIKVEKREKGLYERTDNSTILITEDNKVMLND